MPPTTDDEPDPLSTPPVSTPPKIQFELFDPLNLLTTTDYTSITTWVAAIFTQLQATGSVRAKIVNDQQMTIAHQKFSGINSTTDVLTFDLTPQTPQPPQSEENSSKSESPHSKNLDTDLLICYDQASRQAKIHHHTPTHELLLYIIHGTLHCLGYNDHTTQDYNTMHAYEDQLLTNAGIGPLFNPNNTTHTGDPTS